jgi:hypothetical protein
MQFRISAIQDQGIPASLNEARCELEDRINGALQDVDFGAPETNVLIVIFCTSSLPKEPAPSRLTQDKNGNSILALHVLMEPRLVHEATLGNHLSLLCCHIATHLPSRLARKPKGLNYERLRNALVSCVESVAKGAA